ncbi:MAG: thymidine kinase [Flavobacteriales bacterium]|nr:thymidine kinase [Flavobacteriales bacterium]|tara:strand:+ start:2079 stop:2609 length:531 start_codon:yes stop_codon:yes gene_type:complete
MKEIQVITGCMFAGKTTELINRLRATNDNYLLVKPVIDNRDSENIVCTHDGVEEKAIRVHKISDVFTLLSNIQVVGIDEAQFFRTSIIQDLHYLKEKNIKIIIAGLEKDYLNKPFKSMTQIISMSDSVVRLKAICNNCGKDATCSHRKNTASKQQLLIGAENFYEALCEECFNNSI